MSNETKKFAGLESLQAFLDGCKTIFANITHKHTMSDITDYTVDSELSSESTNPVQNAVLTAELDAKMNASNPTGTGSFSLNRKSGTTVGGRSFAEGYNTTASGDYSHAEGFTTTASGDYGSHAEGCTTTASGNYSHAEGDTTTASGDSSHAEGYNTTASGNYSHAEGFKTTASGHRSHAEGENTIASSKWQHVQGKNNIEDTANTYAHIVGNGTSSSARSNAHTLDWSGNAWYAGTLKLGGTSYDDASEVALKSDIENINLSEYATIIYVDEQLNNKADTTHTHDEYETKVDAQAKYDELKESKSDWNENDSSSANYIENRTHWVEVGREVICQEQTPTSAGLTTQTNVPHNTGGENFIVTIDGTPYSCVSWYNPAYDANTFFIGDSRIWGELGSIIYDNNPEDVPFLIEFYYEETDSWNLELSSITISFADSNTHTVKIEKESDEVTYHQLDENFIPDSIARKSDIEENYALKSDVENIDLSEYETKEDAQVKYDTITDAKADWNQNDENAIDYVKNRTHYSYTGTTRGDAIAEEYTCTIDTAYVTDGQYTGELNISRFSNETLEVVYDDKSYICTVEYSTKEYSDGTFYIHSIGDENLIEYPFYIHEEYSDSPQYMFDSQYYIMTSETGTHTLYVYTVTEDTILKQLDEKFIPDTIARQDYVDSTFAKKSDVQDVDLSNYYTKSEIDNMELISTSDIDTICSATIQVASASAASEVTF